MKHTPITVSIPENVTSRILDFAEGLPKFQKGIFWGMQEHRAEQRKQAEELFNKTNPPQNTTLDYLGFRLFEIFMIEDFFKLFTGLQNLYEKPNEYWEQIIKPNFISMMQSTISGHWMELGCIYRPNENRLPQTIRKMQLPKEVNYINISVQKILPSIICLSFDVFLYPQATEEMKKLHREKYIQGCTLNFPPFTISPLFNKPNFFLQKEAILQWQEKTKIDIENLIFPYLNGVFSKAIPLQPKLPTIEIFLLDTDESNYQDMASLIEGHHDWFNSLGFRFSSVDSFKNRYLLLNIGDMNRKSQKTDSFKVILFKNPTLELLRAQDGFLTQSTDVKPSYIFTKMRFFLESITAPLAIYSNLFINLNQAELIRENIYWHPQKTENTFDLNSTFMNLQTIQSELQVVERVVKEFKYDEHRIVKTMTGYFDNELMGFLDKQKSENTTFSKVLISQIKLLSNTMFEHMSFLEMYYSRHVELLNIRALYNFQIVTVIFTIGAFLLGIFSVIAGWQSILQFFHCVGKFFGQVLNY